MKKIFSSLFFSIVFYTGIYSQTAQVEFIKEKQQPIVHVTIGGKPFTDLFYPDTIAKPVLYPIKAPNGTTISRGYPVHPLAGEPTDHPHHLGLWLNYESVNGLDFWNNSFAIPADKKNLYGTIKFEKFVEVKNGTTGRMVYKSNWLDNAGKKHLDEVTGYEIKEMNGAWVIDRFTTLTAAIPVTFKDVKDGFIGLRVARELQLPTLEKKKYVDAFGIETIVEAIADKEANGNYVNSNGIKGEEVWSKKATWCMLYGKMKTDSISIVMMDHSKNIGYPTNWHARGYGLFAANPLGEKVFTNGKTERNLTLQPNQSVTFRYRIVISSGKTSLSKSSIETFQKDFESANDQLLYVGSYTSKGNKGINVFSFDNHTGKLSFVNEYQNPNASYMVMTPDKKFLYVLGEENKKGAVTSYAVNKITGELTKINTELTIGDGPCYISYHPSSKTVYTANYSSGSVSVFKTEKDGSLLPVAQHLVYKGSSVNKVRQTSSHAHSAVISPDKKSLFVVDLGTDCIYQHTIGADGLINTKPIVNNVDNGNGPRHLVMSANGVFAYVVNEMAGSVDAFQVIASGLKKIQTTVIDTVQTKEDHGSGAIRLSPDGKWLLASNRVTSNQIVVNKVLPDGKLQKMEHIEVTKKPRFFSFDPTGKFVFVCGQDGNQLQVFSFDSSSGKMKWLQNDVDIVNPVAIEFLQ
jgi:6-phosphogluconolactonase (cycloisomerase 2 family)